MARVGSFSSRTHAEMAAGMLDAHGIPARPAADDAGGAAPHVALGAHGFAIEVPDDHADEAWSLLDGVGDTATAESRPPGGWRRTGMRISAWLILGTMVATLVYAATS